MVERAQADPQLEAEVARLTAAVAEAEARTAQHRAKGESLYLRRSELQAVSVRCRITAALCGS
jgi:hypothetical protein